MAEPLNPDAGRFHDGGPFGGDPDPDAPPQILLQRDFTDPTNEFRLLRRIGYRDRELGDLLVPDDPDTFATDFASIPQVFGWLLPRTGTYLPAAILHDGLVGDPGQPASYVSTEGHEITWDMANRVFRDAMADSGTPVVRRWLLWTGVTLAVMVSGRQTDWSPATKWRWRLTAIGSLGLIAVLGVLATLDLLGVPVPLVGGVPWVGEGPWWSTLLSGAAGAVVTPLVLSLGWGRFRAAGVISGLALALLLHVTIAVGLLTLVYHGIERVANRGSRPPP
ncbi:DUF1353 domain-containing protein [Janibacter corallicola]|uniref:DUF1353 domain-containing protein n=1 Tax=Janibacter corallicola TaxID=415212 RepID=UPI000832E669|nr:DUF1353 domain-containing protein [Janibacter corallicola]